MELMSKPKLSSVSMIWIEPRVVSWSQTYSIPPTVAMIATK